jgi:Antibiotic biosynthesis monooxygenase
MIRVMYRWTIQPEDHQRFIENWQEGTRKIQANCAGAFGSFLIHRRKQPNVFIGIARWQSRDDWRNAQPTMISLNLAGPLPESAEFFDELANVTPHGDKPAST